MACELADLSVSLILDIWDTVEKGSSSTALELMSQLVEEKSLGVGTHDAQGTWFTVHKEHPVFAG